MKRGFTLVELSLSIALIGVLSLIVILVISNAVSSYHRGLTLNQLNTVGMALVEDMQTTVQSSPGRFNYEAECGELYSDNDSSEKSCKDDLGKSFIVIERYANVKIGNNENQSMPVYGAFCTGAYSYIWNSGYFFGEDEGYTIQGANRATFSYKSAADNEVYTESDFKLLKVEDRKRAVCKSAAGVTDTNSTYRSAAAAKSSLNNNFDVDCDNAICEVIDGDSINTDVLTSTGNLALYDLTVAQPAESSGANNMFYSISFILGTVKGGINVRAQGDYCQTPDGSNTGVGDFDYCAINKFNFAAQATGG
ncbi:prepilin-type N-terminal cleavage/methylation domain-containing protein [Candidatus Saccharibacteria bacterium]|nr:prepilin-type N-terminal cleavage/methylation domain-containing protein [Candidatus Saccharibacteria bacterium]